jgi:hypothetical protein
MQTFFGFCLTSSALFAKIVLSYLVLFDERRCGSHANGKQNSADRFRMSPPAEALFAGNPSQKQPRARSSPRFLYSGAASGETTYLFAAVFFVLGSMML